jgi:hypothetical protein
MPALASAQDVETSLLRSLTTTEATYVAEWLLRAERLLLARVPDLVSRASPPDPPDPDPDVEAADIAAAEAWAALVAGIEGEMVARVFRNPGGYRQEDEGNYSYRLDAAVASGLLSVQLGEWEALGAGAYRIFSIGGAMDGYAAARYAGYDPSLNFQYGYPPYGGSNGGLW